MEEDDDDDEGHAVSRPPRLPLFGMDAQPRRPQCMQPLGEVSEATAGDQQKLVRRLTNAYMQAKRLKEKEKKSIGVNFG